MNGSEIREKTKQIIANVAGIDIEELDRDLKLREELMLDSLKEMEIVARTELSFGIALDEDHPRSTLMSDGALTRAFFRPARLPIPAVANSRSVPAVACQRRLPPCPILPTMNA